MIIELRKCLAPTCNGASHQWEFEDFTVQELRRLQKTFGTNVDEFIEGMNKGDMSEQALSSLLMLLVLMHRRDGIIVDLDDMDFSMGDFDFLHPDEPDEDEAKPTEPSQTSLQPEGEPDSSSTSGPAPEAESTPRSSTTPPTSGGTSA